MPEWTAETTTEILNVLHVLTRLVALDLWQEEFLDAIVSGPRIDADEIRLGVDPQYVTVERSGGGRCVNHINLNLQVCQRKQGQALIHTLSPMAQHRTPEEEANWQAVRATVLERDGFRCQECEAAPDRSELDVHHVLPRALGGQDLALNCKTLCDSCHAARHPQFQVGLAGRAMRRWALRIAVLVDKTGHLPDSTRALDYGLALFGVKRFREGQLEAVLAAMRGESMLVVRPTGSGKSLCFQLPAVLSPGSVSVVISPLKALMTDQIRGLQRLQIPATLINSDVGEDERKRRFKMLEDEGVRLLYVAPERFDPEVARGSDVAKVRALRPSYLIVDEAHLVDQWGRDFRPNYGRLAEVRKALGDPPVLAFTATADRDRQERIKESLGIKNATTLVSGTDRPNITLLRMQRMDSGRSDSVWMKERARIIVGLVENLSSGRGLIFVPTVNVGERLQMELALLGIDLEIYHGKLHPEKRATLTSDFLSSDHERPPVLITTSAFSLGIDIPDIRLVVHLQHPPSVEEYLQEFGRAGRDGRPSTAVLFSDPKTDDGLLEWMAKKTIQVAIANNTITLKDALEVAQVRALERRQIGDLAKLGDDQFEVDYAGRLVDKTNTFGLCFRRELSDALGGLHRQSKEPLSIRIVRWIFGSKETIKDGAGCCDLCDPHLLRAVFEVKYDAASG